MGLLGFIKSLAGSKVREQRQMMPTVTPEQELFDCYATVYKRTMADVTGLSQTEKDAVYSLIAKAQGGFLNMGAYHELGYEEHFKGRDWTWTEYEAWDERFKKLGRYPSTFKQIDFATPTDRQRRSVYESLMLTMNFRAKSLHDFNRAKKAGSKNIRFVDVFEADAEFSKLALQENPGALPPYYPGHQAIMKSDLPWDD